MGKYNKGILGAFSGKVGPVVGASWRGQEVMRSLPRKGNRIATASQLLQRLKFRTVLAFITPLNPIVNRYFGSNHQERTRNNQAMSYLIREAMTYVAPDFEINYQKVLISKGDLVGMQSPTAVPAPGSVVKIGWVDNSGQGQALATDQLVVAVYEPTTKTTLYSLDAGMRADAGAEFETLPYLSGLTVEVWATFASVDEKQYATSTHLGAVVLT